jgi:two-component system, chemotaxis family, protein-glutamate methylesterase/glutaminase
MSASQGQTVLIVIGASAGGIEPLLKIASMLPDDLPAAVCVVVHFPDTSSSLLPQLLSRRGRLPAQHARDGQRLEAGCIYVAPPGQHLLVADGRAVVTRGPRENGHRPAIDPLFRSAARSRGPLVIGVILSGTRDDGAMGLKLVKASGGAAVVQDPDDALFDAMPLNAIAAAAPDVVAPADQIAAALSRLAGELSQLPLEEYDRRRQFAMGESSLHDPLDQEAAVVAQDKAELETNGRYGEPSVFTCPDCGGVLWEVGESSLLRYRCHVGHTYSAEGLRTEQTSRLEGALWAAVRALEESSALARRLAHRARQGKNKLTAEHFEARALEDAERADVVRRALAFSVSPADSKVNALDSGGGPRG